MTVNPFPSERVFNSATFMRRYIVLTTIRHLSNLYLKKIVEAKIVLKKWDACNGTSAFCGGLVEFVNH